MAQTLSAFALFYIGATAVGALVSTGLAAVAWRRRSEPAAPQFALLNIDVAGWCATTTLIRIGVPETVWIWRVHNVFVFSLIFVWFAFVLAYTGRSGQLRSRAAMVLWAVPMVVSTALLVPTLSDLFVVHELPTTVAGLTVVPSEFTDVGSALLAGVFIIDLAGFVLLGEFFRRSRSPFRTQIGAIIGARSFGIVTGVLFFGGFLPYTDLNLVPAAFAAQSLVIGWAVFRYDLLDITPLAADTIVDQMEDSVLVLDTDSRIIDTNPSFQRLLEEDADTLTGLPAEKVCPGLHEAIEKGTTFTLAVSGGEPRVRTYDPQSTVLCDHHDVYRGQVIVLRDVTLQRTREQTLEALQSATESFLDAPDAEAIADIAVETAESALSSPYSGVVLYDDSTDTLRPVALGEAFDDALGEQGLPAADRDGTALDRDGKIRQVFDTGEPMLDEPITFGPSGSAVSIPTALLLPLGDHGVLGIGNPDSDRSLNAEERRTARTLARATETSLDSVARQHELETNREKLQKRTRQLRFFNSALRHDLRNAITVIDGNLELLSDHVSNNGRSYLESVRTWVADVGGLVETVGSITDTVTNEDDREFSVVSLSAKLDRRSKKVEASHEEINIETDIEAELTVFGDELLGEVLENLLLNAVEHNDSPQPEIRVTARQRDDTVSIRILDNGPGVPAEFYGDSFDPRVSGDDSHSSGSIGFGLYFVKVMIEEYGGSIHFEPNEPRGTVAILTLPTPSINASQ